MPEILTGDAIDTRIVTPTHLPTKFTGKFISLDTTPSVLDVEVWECGGGVVVITQFDDGQDGQVLKLLGNANNTISNNANIATNTGANKVLAANKIYTFTRINAKWYENA